MDFLMQFTGLDLSWWAWLIVLTSGAGIGIAKTAVPGSGILVVALMAMALPSRMSVGVLLPLLIFGDMFALGKFWRYTDRKLLLSLIPFALLGLGTGFFI
ncbi:MAG: sulfite exporter TauE/SafE family protein, partial [Synergistaceae bacterium]|nr:sulfite exporter TauE/SafE family protein [Synergistaceae bacterium]